MVTGALADELSRVLEKFAADAGYDNRNPVSLFFRPGVVGHHKAGRAADIYAVGGVGIGKWKHRWDQAVERARKTTDPMQRHEIHRQERSTNLGWRLYKAQQLYGRWAQPYGYPIQLFGPWTRAEGPWKYISDRLLHAHHDHIHVAK